MKKHKTTARENIICYQEMQKKYRKLFKSKKFKCKKFNHNSNKECSNIRLLWQLNNSSSNDILLTPNINK